MPRIVEVEPLRSIRLRERRGKRQDQEREGLDEMADERR
jgi:hypothetical protein